MEFAAIFAAVMLASFITPTVTSVVAISYSPNSGKADSLSLAYVAG